MFETTKQHHDTITSKMVVIIRRHLDDSPRLPSAPYRYGDAQKTIHFLATRWQRSSAGFTTGKYGESCGTYVGFMTQNSNLGVFYGWFFEQVHEVYKVYMFVSICL